jgi:disease resistance protein RPM1
LEAGNGWAAEYVASLVWVSSNHSHLHLSMSCLQDDIVSSLHVQSALVFLELKKAYDGKLLHFKAVWFPKLNKLNIVELAQLDSIVVGKRVHCQPFGS